MKIVLKATVFHPKSKRRSLSRPVSGWKLKSSAPGGSASTTRTLTKTTILSLYLFRGGKCLTGRWLTRCGSARPAWWRGRRRRRTPPPPPTTPWRWPAAAFQSQRLPQSEGTIASRTVNTQSTGTYPQILSSKGEKYTHNLDLLEGEMK